MLLNISFDSPSDKVEPVYSSKERYQRKKFFNAKRRKETKRNQADTEHSPEDKARLKATQGTRTSTLFPRGEKGTKAASPQPSVTSSSRDVRRSDNFPHYFHDETLLNDQVFLSAAKDF